MNLAISPKIVKKFYLPKSNLKKSQNQNKKSQNQNKKSQNPYDVQKNLKIKIKKNESTTQNEFHDIKATAVT
jgi:hypothetical protein